MTCRRDPVCNGAASPSTGEAPPGPTWVHGRRRIESLQRQLEVAMCRWMAYSGDPILAEELLFRPAHSIIDQSLHAKLAGVTTNGDGFGIGWYGDSTGRRPCTRAPIPPGTTRTCARSPDRSAPRCCSRTSGPRAGPRCSAATATRSGTAAGCGCTTGRSPDSRRSSATCMMAVDPSLFRRDRGIDRHRDPVLPGPHLRPDRGPAERGRPRRRVGRRSRPPPRSRVPGPHDRGRQ